MPRQFRPGDVVEVTDTSTAPAYGPLVDHLVVAGESPPGERRVLVAAIGLDGQVLGRLRIGRGRLINLGAYHARIAIERARKRVLTNMRDTAAERPWRAPRVRTALEIERRGEPFREPGDSYAEYRGEESVDLHIAGNRWRRPRADSGAFGWIL